MARPLRIDFRGARHHVMNRGARKAAIFESELAKQIFLEVLAELPGRFGVIVHAYVIMPNHYHVMISTPRGNLSRAMRHLGAGFTQRLNQRRGWDGPVFRGRFKNRVVGDGRYWMHLVAYLHLNPVPSLVPRPEDWPWSSHRAYLGAVDKPDWLDMDRLTQEFGSRRSLLNYISEHLVGIGTAPDGWDPLALWTPPSSDVVVSQYPPLDNSERGVQEATDDVVAVTGVSEETLVTSRRGRHDNRARWLLAWWLGRSCGLTQKATARYMDSRSPSIANMLLQLRHRTNGPDADPELLGWMEALEARAKARMWEEADAGRKS